MAVNFSQLAPIQAPSIQGSIPDQPVQPSPLAQIGAALTNYGANMQKQKAGDLENELTSLKIEEAKGKLADQQSDRRDADTLREAAKQGEATYIKALAQMYPDKALEYYNTKKDIELKSAQALNESAKASGQMLQNYHETMVDIGSLATNANILMNPPINPQTGQPVRPPISPEQAQNYIKQGAKLLGPAAETFINAMGKEHGFNQETGMVFQILGMQSAAQLAANNTAKAVPSEKMKNAKQIAMLSNLSNPTPEQQAELASLQQQTKPVKMIDNPTDKVRSSTTTAYLKQRDIVKSVSTANMTSLDIMDKLSDTALDGAGANINLQAQKVFNAITGTPINPKVPLSEAFNAFAKTYQISQQVLMKGSSSERDMELLAQTGPQIDNTAQGRKLMINQLRYKEQMTTNQVDFEHAWSDTHNASMIGAQDAWNKFIQSRQDFDPKSNLFTKMPTAKDWQPYLNDNYEAPKTNFIEGKVYTDANGNKAKFENGKWQEIK